MKDNYATGGKVDWKTVESRWEWGWLMGHYFGRRKEDLKKVYDM